MMSRYQDYNHQQGLYDHHHQSRHANDSNNNYRLPQHHIQTDHCRNLVNTNLHGNRDLTAEEKHRATRGASSLQHEACYQQKCLCCPYGFHIDLDFIRYLESLRREMHSGSQSPQRIKKTGPRTFCGGGERSAFSEDESTFAFRNRYSEERRSDSARGPSRPYVVRPKAEPDVLVAIPDELKTQRSEPFLDLETEKKFRASTRLFIDNDRSSRFRANEEKSKFESRARIESGEDQDRVESPRRRSSMAVVIERLENCLATSPTLESVCDSGCTGRDDDFGQLSKVQMLCSKIVSKLRRLHELEEKVRLVPDLDEQVLSLTRQLDQIRLKRHGRTEDLHESSFAARTSTRDVGVGNAVLFPRGGSTSPTFKKFADVSVFSLPPRSSKKVREVSVQVNTTPNQHSQNLNKTAERKFFMNHRSSFENESESFRCKKCGSTEVSKLRSKVTDVENETSKIVSSVDKTFRPSKESIDACEKSGKPEKTPPAVPPKPKVLPKSSSDHEVDEIKEELKMVDRVEISNLEKSEDLKGRKSTRGPFKDFDEKEDEDGVGEDVVECKTLNWSKKGVESKSSAIEYVSTSDNSRSVDLCTENFKPRSLGRTITLTIPAPESTTESSRTVVSIDLLESSSESEEQEKTDSSPIEKTVRKSSPNGKTSKDLFGTSSECPVSETTVEENADLGGRRRRGLEELQSKEGEFLNQTSWVSCVASEIIKQASKETSFGSSSFSSEPSTGVKTRVGDEEDSSKNSTDIHQEMMNSMHATRDSTVDHETHSFVCQEVIETPTSTLLPASPASSPPSGSSSSSSSSPGFATKSTRMPSAPHSSLVNVEGDERPGSGVHLDVMDVEEVTTPSEFKRNLFADTLTSEAILTTTSDSSEAENWDELASFKDFKEQNLFADSVCKGLFLEAAAGKIGALSDPGKLWKNESLSSDFATTSGDDDVCGSSAEASTEKRRQLDAKNPPVEREVGKKETEANGKGTREDATSEASATVEVLKRSRTRREVATCEDARPRSSGFETEGNDFVPLGSPSSSITSQSLDAGINEELASIRNPCQLTHLRSPVPMILVVPSSATPPASGGLSSDLSLFDEEEIDATTALVKCDVNEEDEVGEKEIIAVGDEASGVSAVIRSDDEKLAGEEEEEEEDCFLEACVVYANSLTDPTSVSTSEKDAVVELIRKDWFLTSGRKMSQGSEVRRALSTVRNFGDRFVENVVNMADGDGNTTLHYAVSHGNASVVEALLETGFCDADRQNNAGYTPVMLAALLVEDVHRNFDLLKTLFESGDINTASDRSGQTALMLASSHGREEMVMILLECGADVNVQDEDGSTALMCASEHGHVAIIKALLAHPNCNSSLSDIDGSTALSIAMEEGNHDIGILIYAHMKAHGAVEDEDREPAL